MPRGAARGDSRKAVAAVSPRGRMAGDMGAGAAQTPRATPQASSANEKVLRVPMTIVTVGARRASGGELQEGHLRSL